MKVAVISDTHGRKWTVPECDVLVHAGDFTAGGSKEETKEFVIPIREAILEGKVKHCILVPGNHDECFDRQEKLMREMLHNATYDGDGWEKPAPDRIHLLINQGVEIEGKKFWGSPYTPPFMQWWFMAEEDELVKMYESMPGSLDMLITHGPPRGILDPGFKDPHAGSTELLYAVASRTGHIKHHVFGHLHGAGGQSADNDPFGPTFHNVAAVDESYILRRECKIVEL